MKKLLAVLICIAGCGLPTKDDYRAEGARAERLGLNAESNPYSPGTARKYWYDGYVESRDKRWQEAGLGSD